MQIDVALRHLNHVISEVAPDAPLIFCGDFNSCPDSGNSRFYGILKQVPTSLRQTSGMDLDASSICCCNYVNFHSEKQLKLLLFFFFFVRCVPTGH